MSDSRYLKITVKSTVGVYLPTGSYSDRAATKEALLARLQHAGDYYSDGRANFCVEQLHAAVETLVRDSIERVVEDHLRSVHDGMYQKAIEGGGSAGRWAQERLYEKTAYVMAHVTVHETPISDEHTLEFEIEET